MSLKEIVDNYLINNWNEIQIQRSTNSKFTWGNVASDVFEKTGCVVDGEYLRNRNRKLIKKNFSDNLENGEQGILIPQTTTSTVNIKFKYLTGKENKEKGSKEWTFTASNIPTEQEIVDYFNIDTTKWKIVNIYHKTTPSGKYSITVQTNLLKGVETINLDEGFINKLNSISPIHLISEVKYTNKLEKPIASLLIPKQDAHWNKADIYGNNSIEDRFQTFTKTLLYQLENVIKTHSLEKITYIVGSDEFNSEATGETTKGTPQQNILSYNQSFEKISEFNIETIKLLRFYAPKVEVILLNGNHDHNVGWHLAHLLKQVFKKNESITINDSLENTKIVEFHSNLVLLNHGDVIKPKDLAAKFPLLAKNKWSQFSNYFVICGDKHHEVAHDYHGIMFYQVPQLSNAKSKWDDKMGFNTSKAELLTFLFEEDGLSNILRKQIK